MFAIRQARKPLILRDFLKSSVSPFVPRRRGRHIVRGDFFTKVTSHSFCRGSFPNRTRRAAVGDIAARRWSFTDAACPLRALRWAPIWVRRCAAALSYGEIRFSRLPFLPASQNSILRKRRISAIITETDVRIGGRCRGRSAARTECRPA